MEKQDHTVQVTNDAFTVAILAAVFEMRDVKFLEAVVGDMNIIFNTPAFTEEVIEEETEPKYTSVSDSGNDTTYTVNVDDESDTEDEEVVSKNPENGPLEYVLASDGTFSWEYLLHLDDSGEEDRRHLIQVGQSWALCGLSARSSRGTMAANAANGVIRRSKITCRKCRGTNTFKELFNIKTVKKEQALDEFVGQPRTKFFGVVMKMGQVHLAYNDDKLTACNAVSVTGDGVADYESFGPRTDGSVVTCGNCRRTQMFVACFNPEDL